jgi:hypothetical protein
LAEFPADGIDFEKQIAEAERRYLQGALAEAEGVRTRASELPNISCYHLSYASLSGDPFCPNQTKNVIGEVRFASPS